MFCNFAFIFLFFFSFSIRNVLEFAYISESRALIAGSHELYMKEESEVALHCRIEDSPGPPTFIYWYKVIVGKESFSQSLNQILLH